tara:strand:- start:12125 stop:13342 length:1218 start_codon:yes stop_codon:yes gene_type:complete
MHARKVKNKDMNQETTPCGKVITIRAHEVILKGRNRALFMKALVRNIKVAIKGLGVETVISKGALITAYLAEAHDWDEIKSRLSGVFGVQKFALAYVLDPQMTTLEETIAKTITIQSTQTFAVRASRSQKRFEFSSSDINSRIGAYIQKIVHCAGVNLKNPDLVVHIDVLDREMLLYYSTHNGPGGLPTGTSGRVVCLLSGGIDSPVAAYHVLRRGVHATLVHFHSFPLTNGVSRDKAIDLAERLARYQYQSRLILVPFASAQQHIITTVPAALRVVIYRRFMIRIAERIAATENALALVTGESIGQVASQTLENITSIASAINSPIFRPLIGMNKQDITEQARHIGTYDISKIPDEDCCSLFVPKHPAVKTYAGLLERTETRLDTELIINEAMKDMEIKEFTFP